MPRQPAESWFHVLGATYVNLTSLRDRSFAPHDTIIVALAIKFAGRLVRQQKLLVDSSRLYSPPETTTHPTQMDNAVDVNDNVTYTSPDRMMMCQTLIDHHELHYGRCRKV